MSIICPTVLAAETHGFRDQMERVAPLAPRLQIDLGDGEFTTQSVSPAQVWFPENLAVDIHFMFQRPLEHIETLVSLKPSMVIIHAEASGDLRGMMEHLQGLGIQAGIALLPSTSVESTRSLIEVADHVLIFAGHLGSFGGNADMTQLDKVAEIKRLNSTVEIGWDGGANASNVARLASGGIDVINVGSAIQRADDPIASYQYLNSLI